MIRNRLGKMPGITKLSFDLLKRRLTVEHTLESDASIAAALEDVGMSPSGERKAPSDGADEDHGQSVATRLQIAMLVFSGVLAFSSEVIAWITKVEKSWPIIALAVISILLGGLPTLRKGFIALRTLTLNIDFLMTVAVIGAAAIGSLPEAAMVIFLFAVAKLIESYLQWARPVQIPRWKRLMWHS